MNADISSNLDTRALDVGGYTPLSTVDWPGKLAAVVFVQGCPWRCHYCHNPALQARCGRSPRVWEELLTTLERRQGLLDGVVFSGGEPTLDAGLPRAMQQVRGLGFQVGLHTAGLYPKGLAACLPLVDWVALDVKSSFDDYKAVTSVPRSGEPVSESLNMVLASGLPYEIRTTWHPDLLPDATMLRLGRELKSRGVHHWVLQSYRATPATELTLGQGERVPPDELVARLGHLGLSMSVR